MDAQATAAELLDAAIRNEQAVMRCDPATPVDEIRREVRRLATRRGVRVRTGMLDDVLSVVRADASLWSQPAHVMRERLAAPATTNVVR